MLYKLFLLILPCLIVFNVYSQVDKSDSIIMQLKAENSLLVKAMTPEQLKILKQPKELLMCSGSTPCNCRAGSYGYCTTAKECAEVGGTCY
ncbi:hypothetical protein LT980_14500 [Citrobacter portucalensis]|uniref:hypothetical protein n=1 Tax=Citrobacter portucalensis TaxID=1639133 RepID=UPI00202CDE0B|nr:hypothetical protein [Citrobacter portucalensis]URR11155.1 hypothetical protein LT980_14500 [Citrobacter portucalensis]